MSEDKKRLVEIPENVRVRCPLASYSLRRVAACPDCQHFRGLADRFSGGQHRFAVRFNVLCAGEPAKREILELEES